MGSPYRASPSGPAPHLSLAGLHQRFLHTEFQRLAFAPTKGSQSPTLDGQRACLGPSGTNWYHESQVLGTTGKLLPVTSVTHVGMAGFKWQLYCFEQQEGKIEKNSPSTGPLPKRPQ